MKVLLLGDIGNRRGYHVGDEAMFTANLDWWRERHAEVVGVSQHPEETSTTHGIECVDQSRLPGLPLQAFDVVHISGGGNMGSLFPTLLQLRTQLVERCAAARVHCIVTGQTLGPSGDVRSLAKCAYVGVRDTHESVQLAHTQGVTARSCVDDAFFLGCAKVPADTEALAISLHHHGPGAVPAHSIVAKAQRVVGAGFARSPVFISHFVHDRELASRLGCPSLIPENEGDRTIKSETGAVGLCISTRYHAAVFALSAGVPYVGFYQDRYTHTKLKGAFEVLGLEPQVYPVDRLGPELVAKAWENRHEEAARIRARLEDARTLYEQERCVILHRIGERRDS